MQPEEFSETTGSLARLAECQPATVRGYADAGLIECRRLPNGTRVFRRATALRVREILAEHIARRGGDTRRKSATG